MRLLRAIVFWAMAILVGTSISAHARLTFEPIKTSSGTTVVIVSGDFDVSQQLKDFSDVVQTHGATVVAFNSSGGNVLKAMELGREIRRLGLITFQPKGLECASACALAFFGGILRGAEPGAIGVHKASFEESSALTVETAVSAVQGLTALIVAYMIEMGIDPALLQLSLAYDSDDLRYLSRSEMERFRVIMAVPETGETPVAPTTSTSSLPTLAPPPPMLPSAAPTVSAATPDLTIPEARSGWIRRPQGIAPVKSHPSEASATLANLRNRDKIIIHGRSDRWYRIDIGGRDGYLHDTWVYVEQYESGPFDDRHIQVKSYDNLVEAEAFVKVSNVPVTAYLATNGWFAVTLRDTFPPSTAKILLNSMKEKGTIPEDSYVTYGNTYVRKVCCEPAAPTRTTSETPRLFESLFGR